ncbi:MAG: S-layer homology domain-containing protein [Defluviitaleaceae bacterium]|nr:S-layer homology domain-containing protein [Defluviitaleaceae bacterium]
MAENEINTIVAQGIMQGRPDGTFDPFGTITRAEVAAVLQRYFRSIGRRM